MSFEEDLKLIAKAKQFGSSIEDKFKDEDIDIIDLKSISHKIDSSSINDKILDEIDYYLIKYVHRELDSNNEFILKNLLEKNEQISDRYNQYLKLSSEISETYSAKIIKPIPNKIKNLLSTSDGKKLKIFGITGLGSLAILGWLGTISLGTIQFMGIMATTTIPTAVMRGGPIEEDIEFDILSIEDDCVTLVYDLPDQSSAITKKICLQ